MILSLLASRYLPMLSIFHLTYIHIGALQLENKYIIINEPNFVNDDQSQNLAHFTTGRMVDTMVSVMWGYLTHLQCRNNFIIETTKCDGVQRGIK